MADITLELGPGITVTVAWPFSQVALNWLLLLSRVSSIMVVSCVFMKQDTTLGSATCVMSFTVAVILGLGTKTMLYRVPTFASVGLSGHYTLLFLINCVSCHETRLRVDRVKPKYPMLFLVHRFF